MHNTREVSEIRKWEVCLSRIVTVELNFFGLPEAINANGANEGDGAVENENFWEIKIQIEKEEGETT